MEDTIQSQVQVDKFPIPKTISGPNRVFSTDWHSMSHNKVPIEDDGRLSWLVLRAGEITREIA